MTTARQQYKINHSDIRGCTRHANDKAKRLREVCSDRKFWLGDKWAVPASTAAQAALRTLMNRYQGTDPLRLVSLLPPEYRNVENLKAMHGVVLSFMRVERQRKACAGSHKN